MEVKILSKKFDPLPDEAFEIGEGVLIEPMTTLAFAGFGFEKTPKGKYKIPYKRNKHNFKVIIKDNVHIGASCCIDRGSWRDTVIGEGTRVDNLCHIGHNDVIGKNCLIATAVILGGSCTIGDNCFLGMNCTIKEHVTIADHVTIGMGAVVTKDITEPHTTWVGNPARKLEKKK